MRSYLTYFKKKSIFKKLRLPVLIKGGIPKAAANKIGLFKPITKIIGIFESN